VPIKFAESFSRKPHFHFRYSTVGIATDYGLDDGEIGVRIPVRSRIFSFLHVVQTGSGAHPASYPMGMWGSFPRDKAAGAWN
jgi:hypothetical protein